MGLGMYGLLLLSILLFDLLLMNVFRVFLCGDGRLPAVPPEATEETSGIGDILASTDPTAFVLFDRASIVAVATVSKRGEFSALFIWTRGAPAG